MAANPASPRSVVFSAFRAGSLRAISFRSRQPSDAPLGSLVISASFASPESARRFARRHAIRLGVVIRVARWDGPDGPLFAVALPAAWSHSRPPAVQLALEMS